MNAVRSFCEGLLPLRARLEPWMTQLCEADEIHAWVQQYGSPLNVLQTEPIERNIRGLNLAAADVGLDFRVFYARKANKCLGIIGVVRDLQAGIDTASYLELRQTLNCGVSAERIICTAAIKDNVLLRLCLEAGVTIAVDNVDELRSIGVLVRDSDTPAKLALRVSGFTCHGTKLHSRFGLDVADLVEVVRQSCGTSQFQIDGLHFHLDGGSVDQRIAAIAQSLSLIDQLRQLGHRLQFLDIGGGIPVSYLESEDEWARFLEAHRQALLGHRPPLTYRNSGLGMTTFNGEICGQPNCYPSYQRPVQAEWLATILNARFAGTTIAGAIRARELQLRCEPGRSVLDGCGMTAARVEYVKRNSSGDWFIGLSMNRTQCRTTHDDFLVDPLLVRGAEKVLCASQSNERGIEGYLVGAYCTECDFLLQRKLRFPRGVSRGDLIVFPNTAGYLMHFLESRSHQFPLAKNVYVPRERESSPILDEIDRLS